MSLSRLFQLVLTIACVGIVTAGSLDPTFYRDSISSQFLAVAIASILLIHFSIRPLSDFFEVLATAAALAACEYFVRGWIPRFWPAVCILGLSSALVMAVRAIWAPKRIDRNLLLCGLIPSLLLSLSDWTASILLNLTEFVHPKTLDLYLYRFDCSLGFNPSFLVGQWFVRWHWLSVIAFASYVALPVPLALVYGQQLRRKGRAALPLFYAFLVTGPLGIVCYNILPAMGPVHVFPGFPAYPSSLETVRHMVPIALRMSGPRNAIPSLHMAWVLLAWWGARRLGRSVQLVALAFVISTFFATLGTGEHYFVDLVVACPFALMIHAFFFRSASLQVRKVAAFTGVGLTLVWLAVLSFVGDVFWFSRVIPWFAVIATVGGVWLMQRRLASEQEFLRGSGEVRSELFVTAANGAD